MIPGLPSYVYFLLCCYQDGCTHPVCQRGRPVETSVWYSGGPSITCLPLPVADPERPWGDTSCFTCKSFCAGHYKKGYFTDILDGDALKAVAPPPSVVLKEMFSQLPQGAVLTEEFIENAARAVLLPCSEVQMWFEHLKVINENRKRGAAKAAATRQAKKNSASLPRQSEQWHCGTCGLPYQSQTDETELWIACDMCDTWYHSLCEQLTELPNTEKYVCIKCR